MKTYKVKIKGLTPYMQHRMDDQKLEAWEKNRGPIMERPELSHEDNIRAEYHCYRNKAGKCFIPGDQIRGSLIIEEKQTGQYDAPINKSPVDLTQEKESQSELWNDLFNVLYGRCELESTTYTTDQMVQFLLRSGFTLHRKSPNTP